MTMTNNSTNMLRKLLEVIAGFSELVIIRFSPTGMYLQTMDVARTGLVDIRIPASWFETYKCPSDVDLTTSLVLLVKMLGCIEGGQRAWLQHTEEKGQRGWDLELSGGDKTFVKKFKLPMYDLEDDLLTIPEGDPDTDFVMSSARWAKTVDEVAIFGSVVTVHCGEPGTTLSSQDTTHGVKMSCLIGLEDVDSYDAREGEFTVLFPIALLQRASAARHAACLGPTSTVTVHITEDRPIDLVFDLGDGAIARFVIAPRMDDD